MKMTKKFAGLTVLLAVLSGCGADDKKPIEQSQKPIVSEPVSEHYLYTCDTKATVMAKYDNATETAILQVNIPSWKLVNQDIILSQAPSASGVRYVNDSNPASVYEWFMKGDESLLSVIIGGKEHTIFCQEKAM